MLLVLPVTVAAADKEKDPGAVDVDLTIISGPVVYGQVYDMTMFPEEYIGKTVKMQGSSEASL